MSSRRYPEYKRCAHQWLEELPKHWSFGSLKWLSKRYSGGTPDKNNTEYWINGTIPWINSGAVNQINVTEPSEFITSEAFKNSSAKWVPSGALVMALAGQGKTKGMVAQTGIKVTCNQSMAAIVPMRNISARFLFWWLSINYQNIRNMAGGDLRDGLNLELLGSISCPIPPFGEQKIIASFLDRETAKIDALILEQEKLITLLAEKRQATISHAVTKGVNQFAPIRDSGVEWLGKVPAHWEVKRIRYLLRKNGLVRGPFGGDLKKETFQKSGIKVYEQKNAIYKDFNLGESFITENKFFDMKRFAVQAGDYIMSCSGTIGKVYRIPNGAPCGIINQALLILRLQDAVCKEFSDWLFVADFFTTQIIDNSQGGAMKNLVGMDIFTSVALPVPPLDEQAKIVEFLKNESARLDALSTEALRGIGLLKERRSALISATVTGKIDIRQAVQLEQPTTQEAA